MNPTLIKALILLALTSALLIWSVRELLRNRAPFLLLQAFSAGCLVMVALAHICEALGWFPAMHWGAEHSAGHYLDLSSAVLGVTLLPISYLLRRTAGHAK